MKTLILLFSFWSVAAFAQPIGIVLRTNIPDMLRESIDFRQMVTLHQDQWITVKYFDNCEEETHINSRKSDVRVYFTNNLKGKCTKENSVFPEK